MMLPKGPEIEFREPQSVRWSIIIPVHQQRPGLRRCLESVLPQLKPDMELVVADHSEKPEDWNPRELEEWTSRGVLWCHPNPTSSMAGDWNRAIGYARGEWIQILHDDDWMLPGNYYDIALPQRAGAYYSCYRNETAGKTTFERREPMVPHWPTIGLANFLTPSSIAIRRSVYEKFGGYMLDSSLSLCCDWEFSVRISAGGVEWSANRLCLTVHTEDGSSGGFPLPVQESIRACIRYMHRNCISDDVCIGACNNYYREAITNAVEEEDAEKFWSAVEFNRLALEIGKRRL